MKDIDLLIMEGKEPQPLRKNKSGIPRLAWLAGQTVRRESVWILSACYYYYFLDVIQKL